MRTSNTQVGSFMYLYAFAMFMYALTTANVYMMRIVPSSLMYVGIILLSLFYLVQKGKRFTRREFIICIPFAVYCLLAILEWGYFPLTIIALFFSMLSVMMLSLEEKRFLLKVFTNCFVVMLSVSMIAWGAFLMGVNLPHSGIIYHSNGFHVLFDYYFFMITAKDVIFYRFQSIFLEPGQMATPCAFLFFLNGANFSRKNIVLLLAIILSFSLISYALVMMSLVGMRLFESSRFGILKALAITAIIGYASLYLTNNEADDNPLSALIAARLEYDEEKGISGNNRTTTFFDSQYESFMNSSDRYMGIRQELEKTGDWTYNCSGYKKFIVHRGIIGFFVFMLFITFLLVFNWSFESFLYYIMVVMAFFVRDLLQSPLWLSLCIIGLYMFANRNKIVVSSTTGDSMRHRTIDPHC